MAVTWQKHVFLKPQGDSWNILILFQKLTTVAELLKEVESLLRKLKVQCHTLQQACTYSDLLASWPVMELDYHPSWPSVTAHSIYLYLFSICAGLWRSYHIMLTWEPFNKTIHVNHTLCSWPPCHSLQAHCCDTKVCHNMSHHFLRDPFHKLPNSLSYLLGDKS